jgi:hypothetical protein
MVKGALIRLQKRKKRKFDLEKLSITATVRSA